MITHATVTAQDFPFDTVFFRLLTPRHSSDALWIVTRPDCNLLAERTCWECHHATWSVFHGQTEEKYCRANPDYAQVPREIALRTLRMLGLDPAMRLPEGF